MKFLRLTIVIAYAMHIINMYRNIKYYENIWNCLRDIQQKKNRKFRNVKILKQKSIHVIRLVGFRLLLLLLSKYD